MGSSFSDLEIGGAWKTGTQGASAPKQNVFSLSLETCQELHPFIIFSHLGSANVVLQFCCPCELNWLKTVFWGFGGCLLVCLFKCGVTWQVSSCRPGSVLPEVPLLASGSRPCWPSPCDSTRVGLPLYLPGPSLCTPASALAHICCFDSLDFTYVLHCLKRYLRKLQV